MRTGLVLVGIFLACVGVFPVDRFFLVHNTVATGMAVVYAGRQDGLDRPVAMKVLAEHLAGDTAFRTRFLREARIAARLHHPNLVRVFDITELDGRPCIVMELVPGGTLEGGRLTTAEAAGVAEGTIFRVFDSKEELVDAAIESAFSPGDLERRIEEIDPGLPLRDRLVRLASILQQRFLATFTLMQKVGLVGPPRHLHDQAAHEEWRARLGALMVGVVGPDADRLRVPPEHLVHVLRLLTFAGSHQHIADGRLLTPDQIVDTVLDGLLEENH